MKRYRNFQTENVVEAMLICEKDEKTEPRVGDSGLTGRSFRLKLNLPSRGKDFFTAR